MSIRLTFLIFDVFETEPQDSIRINNSANRSLYRFIYPYIQRLNLGFRDYSIVFFYLLIFMRK